jgi:hypothetical protein
VQSVRSALPKFDCLRSYLVATPERGKRHLTLGKFAFHLFPLRLEKLTRGDLAALRGGPRRELAFAGAGREVLHGFNRGQLGSDASDDDLTLERQPGKEQRRRRIRIELASLTALKIGKENEPLSVDAFQKDSAHERASTLASRGKDHGVGFGKPRAKCLVKPERELRNRIREEVCPPQSLSLVVLAKVGKIWRYVVHAPEWYHSGTEIQLAGDGLMTDLRSEDDDVPEL